VPTAKGRSFTSPKPQTKPSPLHNPLPPSPKPNPHSYESKYAREVEISNGRAAMVGFLIAVLVEAGTGGYGILGQLIMWGKITGFLGAASGF